MHFRTMRSREHHAVQGTDHAVQGTPLLRLSKPEFVQRKPCWHGWISPPDSSQESGRWQRTRGRGWGEASFTGRLWLSFLLAAQDHNGPSQRYVGSLRTGLAAFQGNKPPHPPHTELHNAVIITPGPKKGLGTAWSGL